MSAQWVSITYGVVWTTASWIVAAGSGSTHAREPDLAALAKTSGGTDAVRALAGHEFVHPLRETATDRVGSLPERSYRAT